MTHPASPSDPGRSPIAEYLKALEDSPRLGHLVAHHEELPARDAVCVPTARPLPPVLRSLLEAQGIEALYRHQARAMDLIRAGKNVVVATPTASGKTLVYNLPVLEALLANPDSRALYLFPLKALAQDQLRTLEELTLALPPKVRPACGIYDGDTSPYKRRKFREEPPGIMLSNPEMVHLSLLPFHDKWATFLAGLTHVVVDEVHTYRGVMGSHMAHVFRRLLRLCAYYGSSPQFIFCSATIGNPAEHAAQLTGLPVEVVSESGAPMGRRHVCFVNPTEGAAQTAILMLQAALARGLRTIVYAQSRKMTELIALWASERAGEFKDRISAYRSGFLPEERREIEAKMANGDLLAVVSTSALELGIDIGNLDLCLLVGYPGTIMSTWQRGGRVGRGQQDSAVVLIAQEDALDQYFMRNPRDFFERAPERAVLNPYNEIIMARHLQCAAAELPLRPDEPFLREEPVKAKVRDLIASGGLLESEDRSEIYSPFKSPHRDVDLRGAGGSFHIEDVATGEAIGLIDEFRAYREAHPGAVYLHRGKTYRVEELNLAGRTVKAVAARVGYYTRVRGHKTTEILEVHGQSTAWGARVYHGRLKVTETITGYEKRRVNGSKLLNIVPLDLPPLTFETDGLWFEISREVQAETEKRYLHFMGGIHAVEHAAIGILPLLVMTDRNDLGGISTPFHEQVDSAAVFIYDGAPGGVGLTSMAFSLAETLLDKTLSTITNCPCELGCPSCVHSPKCGSGNRPIDKEAAKFVLECIRSMPAPPPRDIPVAPVVARDQGRSPEVPAGPPAAEAAGPPPMVDPFTEPFKPAGTGTPVQVAPPEPAEAAELCACLPGPLKKDAPARYAVLDVETQRSAAEVGGWHKADRMGVSVAVLYDSARDEFMEFLEEDMGRLVARLGTYELVVGFNIRRFDYQVLRAYHRKGFASIPTLDMLDVVHGRLGYRLSLDSLAAATLGAGKSADGLQALAWWKEGKIKEIAEYCTRDVAITRDLYLYGRDNGYLLFKNKAGKIVRLPVVW